MSVHKPDEPTTVYTVVEAGETVTEAPDKFPGVHVKLAAPAAESVTEFPLQIKVLLAETVTDGGVLTATKTVAELEQPALSPSTV